MKTATSKCRRGTFTYFDGNDYIGAALAVYGEYSEQECRVLEFCIKPGQTVIDVGANIGAFTVPMSKLVGERGRVIAFEPSTEAAKLLRINLAQNGCANVTVRQVAASSEHGSVMATGTGPGIGLGCILTGEDIREQPDAFEVPRVMIDSFGLETLSFLKIDVDGHERAVLEGARETIMRCRPVIYCENDRPEKAVDLIAKLVELGYRLWWHRAPQFNPDNYNRHQRNMFGGTVSIMMLCLPDEMATAEVKGMDEVSDIREDDLMFDREIARNRRYVERNPDDLMARWQQAYYESLMQRHEAAEALMDENLRRDPQHIESLNMKGLWALQRGDWATGWPAYELRYRQKNPRQFGGHRRHDVPAWDGSPTNEPVLIWNEQGFGDTIMFGRFFSRVLERAPNAMLEVQPHLFELFEQSGIAPPGRLHRLGRALPPYKLHCSLPSVPATLKLCTASELTVCGPYLRPDPVMVQNWAGKGDYAFGIWGPLGSARIGVCCEGSPRSERPFTRNIPSELFNQLNRRHGPFISLTQQGQFDSFADTAAMLANLDLVITVDTSVAHLAGALGLRTWLLLSIDPDWRWGLNGDSTLWYPSITIFRQRRFRDWQGVMDDVGAALDADRARIAEAAE